MLICSHYVFPAQASTFSSSCIWRKYIIGRVFVFLHNFPLVSFHAETLSVFWLWQACSAQFETYSTLPTSVSILLFLPSPYGFKTSKHACFSFMLFCTASMMQKNDTRCDAQTSVFLTPKPLFYTMPLWLVLFTQPWLRQEKTLLLRSVRMWSTSRVFPSHATGKPIEDQWGTDT